MAGIEDGVGSVVLATLTKAEEEFSRWLFSHFLVPILIHLIWSHCVTGPPALSFDKSGFY